MAQVRVNGFLYDAEVKIVGADVAYASLTRLGTDRPQFRFKLVVDVGMVLTEPDAIENLMRQGVVMNVAADIVKEAVFEDLKKAKLEWKP